MTHSHSHSSGITVQTVVSPASCHSSVPTCPPDHDVLRVLDIATRDAIPACRRYEGLWVEVLSDLKFYRLIGGLSNDCWVSCGGGHDHGGEISPDDLPIASKTEKGIVQIGENIGVNADGLIAVAKASEDAAGVVELASAVETKAGTDTTKAVTPAGLAEALVQDKVDHPFQAALEYIRDSVHFYVRSDGDDDNTGLDDSPSGAWRTIQRAVEARRSYLTAADYNSGPLPAVHVHVGDGTFSPIRVENTLTDAESFVIEGMGEDRTIIEGFNKTAVVVNNGGLKLKNMMLHTVIDKNSAGNVISVSFSSCKLENVSVKLTDNRSSEASGTVALVWCTVSVVNVLGAFKIFPVTPYANGGLQGLRVGYNCFFSIDNSLEIVGNPTLGYTAVGYNASIIAIQSSASVSGTVLGRKYSLANNSIIDSGGRGEGIIPGTIDGTITKGGAYY